MVQCLSKYSLIRFSFPRRCCKQIRMLAVRIGFRELRPRFPTRLPVLRSYNQCLAPAPIRHASSSFSSLRNSLLPNESLAHTLPDGRILGFSSYGPESGYPVLFFHGIPGSRIDARSIKDLDPGLGLRIIGVDRPGIGLSSPHASRALSDWPSDVGSLAQYLGFKDYKVVGISGGGPFALACAHAASRGKMSGLSGTGVICGMAPLEAGLQGMNSTQWMSWKLYPYLPLAYIRFTTQWFIGRHAANPDSERFEKAMRKLFVDYLTPEEKVIMLRPDMWRELLDSMREVWAQGADGYARDAKLMATRWGFDLGDVDKRVLMWWGTADDLTPVGMGRWMARRLRNATLREFVGDTHWTIVDKHGKLILRELMEG